MLSAFSLWGVFVYFAFCAGILVYGATLGNAPADQGYYATLLITIAAGGLVIILFAYACDLWVERHRR